MEGDPNQPCEAGGRAQPPARSLLRPGDATPQPDPGARTFRYLVLWRCVRFADRSLPQLGHAWRPRRDAAAGEQRSRRSGQLSAGARGLRWAGPAPPEPLAGPTAALPPAVKLCPAQCCRRPFTQAKHGQLAPPPAR